MPDTLTPVAPSIVLLSTEFRQSLFAREREAWWLAEADGWIGVDATMEARCRNEAAFWAADATPLAELLERIRP